MPAPEPGMERLISSITEAVAAGFREATKQQFEDLRRSLGVLNVTLESMTKGLDVIKENQNDRKVKFALMESRLGEVEKDITKNDAEIKEAKKGLSDATGTINKGIGTALAVSTLLPVLVAIFIKLVWK